MRLIICGCRVEYEGRINTSLDSGERLLIIKHDGSFSIQNDVGYKPMNYMTAPTRVEINGVAVEEARPRVAMAGPCVLTVEQLKTGEKLTVLVEEIALDWFVDVQDEAVLRRVGNEKDFQEVLSLNPGNIEDGLRVIEREKKLRVGLIDLWCRDQEGKFVIVEVKRAVVVAADIDQLARYVEEALEDEEVAARGCRGVFVAPKLMPQAAELMRKRGLEFVPLTYQEVTGEAEKRKLF